MNEISEWLVAAFIRFQPIHTCFKWTVFLFLVKAITFSIYGRCFQFLDLVQLLTLFCFSAIAQRNFSRQPVALSGDSVPPD